MVRAAREPQWVIGWREWIELPELQVRAVKVKIDTGARSSALHATDVQYFQAQGKRMVRFVMHPHQRDLRGSVRAEAPLVGHRKVRDSGGHVETRPVITTKVRLHERCWNVELTLTDREEMGFRMLLGRLALRRLFVIDPGRSFLCGDGSRKPTKGRKVSA